MKTNSSEERERAYVGTELTVLIALTNYPKCSVIDIVSLQGQYPGGRGWEKSSGHPWLQANSRSSWAPDQPELKSETLTLEEKARVFSLQFRLPSACCQHLVTLRSLAPSQHSRWHPVDERRGTVTLSQPASPPSPQQRPQSAPSFHHLQYQYIGLHVILKGKPLQTAENQL